MLETIAENFPVSPGSRHIAFSHTGLIIVDEVNGFCTVGAGPLAPAAENAQVARMVEETDRLALAFDRNHAPIAVFLDTHEPGKAEPPYPPHCERGSGQEKLVDRLAWLGDSPHALKIEKDCINGFVGSIGPGGENLILDWIIKNRLDTVVVVGICTDICVMDFVLTLLSARNHGIAGGLKDVLVYEPGCATYDLPLAAARDLGLPDTSAHPQDEAHHLGLYFMALRGAEITQKLDLPEHNRQELEPA